MKTRNRYKHNNSSKMKSFSLFVPEKPKKNNYKKKQGKVTFHPIDIGRIVRVKNAEISNYRHSEKYIQQDFIDTSNIIKSLIVSFSFIFAFLWLWLYAYIWEYLKLNTNYPKINASIAFFIFWIIIIIPYYKQIRGFIYKTYKI